VPDPAITGIAAEVRQDLSAWQAGLAPAPMTAARPALLNGTIAAAVGWLRAHLAPLHAASAFTREVSEVCGPAADVPAVPAPGGLAGGG
jgi:hypothetical protein